MLFWNFCIWQIKVMIIFLLANQGPFYWQIQELWNTSYEISWSLTNLVRLRFQLQIPKANVVATNFHQITVTNLTSLRKTNNWCLFEEIWFQKVQRAIPGKSQRASNWAGKAILLFRYNISYTCYLHHQYLVILYILYFYI